MKQKQEHAEIDRLHEETAHEPRRLLAHKDGLSAKAIDYRSRINHRIFFTIPLVLR